MTRAILAGTIATIIVSIILIAQTYFGVLPQYQLIAEWQKLLEGIGIPAEPWHAWVAHVLVGAVFYGIVFAALEPILPGNWVVEGLEFGLIAWLAMLVVFMPLTGNGFFGVTLGAPVILATLALHVVYGLALGISYNAMAEEDEW